MEIKYIRNVLVAAPVLMAISAPSQAVTLSFGCITDNDLSGVSCGIAENQMSVDITDASDATTNKQRTFDPNRRRWFDCPKLY